MPRADVIAMLRDEDTLATTLLVWARDEFGPEVLTWHPGFVRLACDEVLSGPLPDDNFDRLVAAIAVLTTDLFFKNATTFSHLAPALCGDGFDPGEFAPPDAAECAWAITEAILISPPEDDDPEPFSDDVRRFVGHVLRDEGFARAPDVLAIALDLGDLPDLDDDVRVAADQMQRRRDDDIKAVMRDGLLALADQLERLDLRRGDATEIVRKVRAAL